MNPVLTDASLDESFRAGIAAYRRGAFDDAAAFFIAVLERFPNYPGARINLANTLWSAGDYEAAGRQAEYARRDDRNAAEAWMITGAIRLDSGDAVGANAAYTEAVRLAPTFSGAHAGLAAALLAADENDEAERAANHALALDAANSHALFTLGAARLARRQPHAALEIFDALIARFPDHGKARHNRANALIDLGRLDDAKVELFACVAQAPRLKEAWATLGYVLTLQAGLPAAVAACDEAIALDKDFAAGHWNRSVALLMNGDFADGFAAYEWRKRHPAFRRHFTPMQGVPWQGENLAGKHLLVRAEQGFGDAIMLARFLPQLAGSAARVTLCCPPCLFPLFRHFNVEQREPNDPPGAPDFSVDQMSLPHILQLGEGNIPFRNRYLRADPARRAAFVPTLPVAKKRIGLVWAGNPGHDNDHHRSLAVGAFMPLLAVDSLSFVALQIGARRGEYVIHDAAASIRDYGDTAAILSGLDALVTVDTSVAHLAGAMGVPCHVLLSTECDWRWRLGRNDSAWYDSVTLHRQEKLDDWSLPVASVLSSLVRTEG